MPPDIITKIEIDNQGRLLVYPGHNRYTMIYREAAEVNWDNEGRYLYSPPPREWSYLDWYNHIVKVAGDLVLTPDTEWVIISEELREQLLEKIDN
jgi:DNA-binding transcriptional regulator/RsmH inhibitor MraZ